MMISIRNSSLALRRARKSASASIVLCSLLASAIPLHAQTAAAPPAAIPVTIGSPGGASINLTPRRVIFDNNKRTEAIYVFNQGSKAATVEVSLIDNVMLADGDIVPLSQLANHGSAAAGAAEALRSAHDMILATPSRLLLEPGKGKTIRLRASLPDGATTPMEFRTHLTVTTLPDADTGLTADAAAATERGELSMRVQSVFGISIPLIVRSGDTSAAASVSDISIVHGGTRAGGTAPNAAVLQFSLGRTGTSSIYGNIEVRAGEGKNAEMIGFVRGISVYSELAARQVHVNLMREPRKGELLTIKFTDDEGRPGGPSASGTFHAP
ncbi:hypothetical protein [Novosphingobium sp. AAP93]|uniref:hypothetical protein n=1 Tax=Novosphingobium sp. AAP93 TaxID=1523427 RepID=UPI0006B89A6B|nr:hypothetical protein [Novosphingobium sp. AAP93]KPF89766.1 hypothetical protein IP83_01435 [Novosphingobium sp. AAP93]